MRKISCLLTVLLLLFCAGCVIVLPDVGNTEIPPTAPQKTVPSTPLSPKTTVPTTVPVDENIDFFTKLFDFRNYDHPYWINHYNMAMCCEFSRPEELPLATFFFNGLTKYNVTEEERAYIKVNEFEKVHRLVPEEMNEVLGAYFDVSLNDINWDVVDILYWEQTGYFYTVSGGVLACNFVISEVKVLDDGIFRIWYYNGAMQADYVITLQSRESEGGEGFRILSNLPA